MPSNYDLSKHQLLKYFIISFTISRAEIIIDCDSEKTAGSRTSLIILESSDSDDNFIETEDGPIR